MQELIRSANMYNSQLYRMQDPADPMWRVVTTKDNEKKWQILQDKTEATADGKVDIVMVQDSPMLHRVQRIEGDPSDLIASQLMVSRAVGMTAISIAEAALGTNVVSKSLDNSKPEGTVENQLNQDQPTLALAKARLESNEAKFKALRTRFIAQMETLRDELQTADTDNIAAVDAKIKGALKQFANDLETIANQ